MFRPLFPGIRTTDPNNILILSVTAELRLRSCATHTRGMVSGSTVRYASWPYFFALLIMSAGVIVPLLVMVTRLRRNLFKQLRREAE